MKIHKKKKNNKNRKMNLKEADSQFMCATETEFATKSGFVPCDLISSTIFGVFLIVGIAQLVKQRNFFLSVPWRRKFYFLNFVETRAINYYHLSVSYVSVCVCVSCIFIFDMSRHGEINRFACKVTHTSTTYTTKESSS